jgi:ASC-1-like (ASCH) protein
MKHNLVFRAGDKSFDAIVDGRKTIESRAATPRYRKVAVGDELVIRCGKYTITKVVKRVEIYPSIDELLAGVGLNNVMPLVKSGEQAKQEWYSYPGYRDKIAQHGLVAWFI